MRLKDVTKQLGHDAKFYSPDGTRVAMSTMVRDVLRYPSFKLVLAQGGQEYTIINKESFCQMLSVHTPQENAIYEKCNSAEIKSKKAAAIAKLFGYVKERVAEQGDK